MKELIVILSFTEELLGTANNDPNVHSEFILANAPDAISRDEEIAAVGVSEVFEKSMTVFPRTCDGLPALFDYQVKGYFKDACSMLARLKNGNESSKLKAYKNIVDGLIFVTPRLIPIMLDGEIGSCQRPFRANTPQGERVALVTSESVPIGSTVTFSILLLDPNHEKAVREWLDYGMLRGIGQWRNSGKGRFMWEELQSVVK